MKTGVTAAVLRELQRATGPLMVPDLARILPRYDKSSISSALGNLCNQNRIVRVDAEPVGRFCTAYAMPEKAPTGRRKRPVSGCLLQEVWG